MGAYRVTETRRLALYNAVNVKEFPTSVEAASCFLTLSEIGGSVSTYADLLGERGHVEATKGNRTVSACSCQKKRRSHE